VDPISENVDDLAARSLKSRSSRWVCLNVLWCQALTHMRVHNTSDNDNPVFEQCQFESS